MTKSKSWKDLELWWRNTLNKKGLIAVRKARGEDWSQKIDDVGVGGADWLISDCKYSIHSFYVNQTKAKICSLLEEVDGKYRKGPIDQTIIITKGYKERGAVASCDAEFLADMLAFWIKHEDLRNE